MGFGGGERLAGLLSDPAARGILGASAGLLAAGAPRTDRPVSLGEAISTGLLSGTQAFDEALAAKQRRDAAKALQDFRLERFDYLKSRDILADQLKADETAYSRGRDSILDTRYDDETTYLRGRDTILDTRYDDETAYSRSRDAILDTRYDDETSYNRARNEIADQRATDEAALLARLREARINELTKPKMQTEIAKINQDVANGFISREVGDALISNLLKPDEVLPLSPEGELARDRRLGLLGPETDASALLSDSPISELPIPDLRAASTGDIPGMFQNAVNFVAGMFGSSAFPDTQEAKAQLNLMNEQILTPMVRAMSDKGAVYTQKVLRNLLPQTNLSNQENFARMSQLPSKIQIEIETAEATLADTSQSDAKRASAARSIRELKPLLSAVEKALATFETPQSRDSRGRNRNRVGTVDSSQGKIKFKRVDDGTD